VNTDRSPARSAGRKRSPFGALVEGGRRRGENGARSKKLKVTHRRIGGEKKKGGGKGGVTEEGRKKGGGRIVYQGGTAHSSKGEKRKGRHRSPKSGRGEKEKNATNGSSTKEGEEGSRRKESARSWLAASCPKRGRQTTRKGKGEGGHNFTGKRGSVEKSHFSGNIAAKEK